MISSVLESIKLPLCHKELTLHKPLPSTVYMQTCYLYMESHLWRFRSQVLLLFSSTGLGTLCAVLGAGLVAACNTLGVQSAADDVVTHTGQVLDTAAADQNDRVLLQVVADAGNVRGDLDTIRQADTYCFF